MPMLRTALIAGAASALLAGAALAAHDESRTMLVALPDGSVQHIQYRGDVAPRLVILPAAQSVGLLDAAFGPGSPFAEMERISAAMDAQAAAMMRQAATLQAQVPAAQFPAAQGKGVTMTNAQGEPVGVMHYSYVSSTTSADGCTQTVSYSSDAAAASGEPRIIRTSSGDCGAGANPVGRPGAVTPTAAPAKPAPTVTPVSAAAPAATPATSRT